MQLADVELVRYLIQEKLDENEIVDMTPSRLPEAKRGGEGGVPLTGDCWLLGRKFTYDTDTDKPFLVGYADGSGVELMETMPEDMPANTYVRKLANEQGDIYMGC